jgi:hypothetical protein
VWTRSEPGVVPNDATLVSSVDETPFQVWEVQPGPATADYLDFKIGGPACDTLYGTRTVQPLASDSSAAARI